MSLQPVDISGFFTMDRHTRGTRIAWSIGFFIGLAILYSFIIEVRRYLGPASSQQMSDSSGSSILLFIVYGLIGVALTLAGLMKMMQKPGVFFNGIRVTPNGFESGSFLLSLSDVEISNNRLSGNILQANWKVDKSIAAPSLSVSIFLKSKESKDKSNDFFFYSIVIASNDEILLKLGDFDEVSCVDLIAMLRGAFNYVYYSRYNHPNGIISSLEHIANVLESNHSGEIPTCTLLLLPKSATSTNPSLALFGALGGLIISGMDSHNKKKLQDQFREGKIFDADLTEQLIDFVNRKGWNITVGGSTK